MTVRSWWILPTVVVLLCGCDLRSVPPAAPAGVGVLVVEPSQLVATVIDGVDEAQAFHQQITVELINRGDGPLEITEVSSSCGCTVAEKLATEKLSPSARTTLVLNVELPTVGRKMSWVRIETDSKSTPRITIPVSLVGRPLHPPYLDHEVTSLRLYGTRPGEPVSQKLTLRVIERKDSAPWIQMLKPQTESIRVDRIGNPNDEPSEDETCVKRTYTFQIEMNVPDSADRPTYGFIDLLYFARGKLTPSVATLL